MVSCSGSSTLSTAYSSSHSCVGAPREGGVVVYPWSPGPVTSGRSCSRDAEYSAGPLPASWVGWWRRRALDRCVQGARSRGGGCGGYYAGRGPRGRLLRARAPAGEVHMLLRVLRVLELQL